MRHRRHLRSVEVAQVKARHFSAALEHGLHILHFTRVDIGGVRDVIQIRHIGKPIVGGLRAGIGERQVEVHAGDLGIGAVGVPAWLGRALVQVVGRLPPAFVVAALVIEVESQQLCRRVVAGVSSPRCSEIAGVAGAAVDVGVGLVCRVRRLPCRALAAHKMFASREHMIGTCHSIRAPAIAHIDGLQIVTIPKHLIHIGNLGRVEGAQVKARQTAAIIEHLIHIGYVGRVEVAHVKARQTAATVEHQVHIGYVGRVEVAQVEVRQTAATIEHLSHLGHLGRVEVAQVKARQAAAATEH